MLSRHRFTDIGTTHSYVPVKLGWLPVVMGALSVGAQLFGASKSAEKEQEARKREDAYSARREALARRQMNEEDTRAGRRLVRQAQESGDKLIRRAQGSAAMTGSLNEVAQAKEMANQKEANARESAAIMAERRQERGEAQMDAVLGQRSQQEASRLRSEGQNTAAVAGAMANMAGTIASADFGSDGQAQSDGIKFEPTGGRQFSAAEQSSGLYSDSGAGFKIPSDSHSSSAVRQRADEVWEDRKKLFGV